MSVVSSSIGIERLVCWETWIVEVACGRDILNRLYGVLNEPGVSDIGNEYIATETIRSDGNCIHMQLCRNVLHLQCSDGSRCGMTIRYSKTSSTLLFRTCKTSTGE